MNCPICASESVVVAKLSEGELLKCEKCYWLFTQNVPIKLFEKLNLNEEKRNEYLSIVQKASAYVELKPQDKVLDINSGDGTLLGWYLKNTVTVGVEPDAKLMKEALNQKRVDVPVMAEFSSKQKWDDTFIGKGRFKIITIVDCFQDLAVLPSLIQCKELLESEGVIVVQAPYFPQMLTEPKDFVLSQNYILAYTLRSLFQKVGLELQGVQFTKKSIRGYGTNFGFKRFGVSDFEAKLKMYTQMSAAIITELHARFDLDESYTQLEQKLHPVSMETRNAS
jgi:hypothetical protein